MREHLGILDRTKPPKNLAFDVDLDDPAADSFFNDVWRHWAKSNTDIYEKVGAPHDDSASCRSSARIPRIS